MLLTERLYIYFCQLYQSISQLLVESTLTYFFFILNSYLVYLDSENKMLKKQVAELREQNANNQSRNEELEQYGRRLCLRIDGVPTVKHESSDDVLEFTKSLFQEANVAVPDTVLDCAHRIGPSYTDRITSKKCKSIIVRFTNFDTGLYSIGQEKI